MITNAKSWIEKLNLQPHPEGGYFKESYRSSESMSTEHLPARFGGNRAFATAIFYLLEQRDFSAFHRIKADEVWHFYDGGALLIHMIDESGNYHLQKLGHNIDDGEIPQFVVPAGTWFAAECDKQNTLYSLVGCTVAPGFDFNDFEMARREDLIKKYPDHEDVISYLTRN